MKYEKIKMGAYNIHFIKTNKFKTTTISVNFREKIKKENITMRKFLFQMLTNNTLKYNTERLLEIKLEDLYSLILSHSNIKLGNYINSYIDIKFLNEKYSDKNLLYDSIDLLYEIIFNPNVIDNMFDTKNFNIIKNKLNLIIKSSKENTQKYALNKALEVMDKDDPISYSLWGYKSDLNKINEYNLYEYYKHVLNTNNVDIFIVGNVDKDTVINYINSKFKFNNTKKEIIKPFITYKECNKLVKKTENMNLKQSKLVVICKLLNLNLFERRYVLPLYSSILGAGSTSRLFTNVREKESLAYTITSLTNSPNSILMIYGGIDINNYMKALDLINKELILKNISNNELENAKKEIIASLETIFDSPASIINYYYGIEVFDADSINKKINSFSKVTKKDIENLGNKIKIASIYFLKGIKNEEE